LVPLPSGVAGFHDISIDVDNDSLVFALDVNTPAVCSYSLENGVATLINCVGQSFATSPFCGVSGRGGTLVISGGTGGVTVFDYDVSTGMLDESPRVLNQDLDVIGFPDVLMISPTQAAMSTDIDGGTPRFGTVILDVQGTTLSSLEVFRMEDSLGFELALAPTNFPFVNAIYTSGSFVYLYTANGGMTVQNPNDKDAGTTVIDPLNEAFRAVTVAVNQDKGLVVFGGLEGTQSVITVYSIMEQRFVEAFGVEGRITSVATSGDFVSFVTVESTTIEILAMGDNSGPSVSSPTASPVVLSVPQPVSPTTNAPATLQPSTGNGASAAPTPTGLALVYKPVAVLLATIFVVFHIA